MTMEQVLAKYKAECQKVGYWLIENKEKGWVIRIDKDAVYPDTKTVWPWKVDTQFFNNNEHAAKYLSCIIDEKNTGVRIIPHAKREIPDICGISGCGCRRPDKCNSMLCSDCPVAEEFFARQDGVTLKYEEDTNELG